MHQIAEITLPLPPFSSQVHTWTLGAMACYLTKADCGRCLNRRSLSGECHMPKTIAVLLAHGVRLPDAKRQAEALEERTTINANPGLNDLVDISQRRAPWDDVLERMQEVQAELVAV